ncbi:signal protein PDZ, partial [Mesorhizobium sp. M7A.F.Ca.CA.004.05.1.1]
MTINPNPRSVVAVRATVPEDAFTAGALGTLRE